MATYTITNDADDGRALIGTGTPGGCFSNQGTISVGGAGFISAVWLRFKGITIPQGSNVSSATLNWYSKYLNGASPLEKTTVKQDTRISGLPALTQTGAQTSANLVHSPANAYPAISVASGLTSGQTSWTARSIDVTSNVSSLVANNDYSIDDMLFYLKSAGSQTIGIYGRHNGTTNTGRLEINYTEPVQVLTDKTTYEFV